MRAANSTQELLARPGGQYVQGHSVTVWAHSDALIGAFHFAPLAVDDHPMLVQTFPLVVSPLLHARYDLLHDLGGVAVLDPAAFDFFEQFLHAWADHIASRVRRLAVVRPTGLAGAAFTGMYHEWVTPRFDARLCESRVEAQAFLDLPAEVCAELDAVHDAGTKAPILRQLRDALRANLLDASIERIAVGLGTSLRSLQRQLHSHGTSFRRELVQAKVRAAEVLLLDTDRKIDAVARDLGFSSAASFSTTFRQVTGESPGFFRSKSRGAS